MDRFKKVYSQGMIEVTEIWVDQETGVHYHKIGSAKQRASPIGSPAVFLL